MGMGVEKLGVSSHSAAVPSAKKRVRPMGNIRSSPNSSSTSNLTCFLLGALGHHLTAPAPRLTGSHLQVEMFHGTAELLIGRMGLWRAREG